MILFKKINDLHNYLDDQQRKNFKIGFVPTMGALHAGHISLINTSKKENEITLCSIFVNPTQFNDKKDFEKYPSSIESDIYSLESNGCDILFLPDSNEVYPDGFVPKPNYDLGYLETLLEGKFRPGHFQGVCMVMHKLLDIVKPINLYLGQKDYQQCMVIKRLVGIMGQKDKINIIICPTLREPDGLAMSSRNMRLAETERKKASAIYQSLNFIRKNIALGKLYDLKNQASSILTENGFEIDYVEIADADLLEIINEWDGKRKLVAVIAAFINEVRLIDNLLLN